MDLGGCERPVGGQAGRRNGGWDKVPAVEVGGMDMTGPLGAELQGIVEAALQRVVWESVHSFWPKNSIEFFFCL